MKTLKKTICIILLIFTALFLLSSCVTVPEDDIKANLVTVQKTYKRSEGVTEIFFLFDVLNGKERAVSKFELDVDITFLDGAIKSFTIISEEDIPYARSYPLNFVYTVEGRADSLKIIGYRFETYSYWETFGTFILSTLGISIIVAVILVALSMAEMDGMVSVGAGAVVLFCLFYVIFGPFAESLYVIIGTLISLVPLFISKRLEF